MEFDEFKQQPEEEFKKMEFKKTECKAKNIEDENDRLKSEIAELTVRLYKENLKWDSTMPSLL